MEKLIEQQIISQLFTVLFYAQLIEQPVGVNTFISAASAVGIVFQASPAEECIFSTILSLSYTSLPDMPVLFLL